MSSRRWIVTPVALACLLASCSPVPVPAPSSGAPTSVPSAPAATGSPPEAGSVASSFDDLPYTLDMPDGWVFGTVPRLQARVAELQAQDPDNAPAWQRLLDAAPIVDDAFVAFRSGGGSGLISGNSIPTGGLSPAIALDESERQNLEGIRGFPGLLGDPVADRIVLPVGEAVRIRWSTHDAFGPGTGDIDAVGYAIVADERIYVFVCSSPAARFAELEPTFERIVSSFRLRETATSPAPDRGAREDARANPGSMAL